MDTLLRLVTARKIAALFLVLGFASFAAARREAIFQRWTRWRYPATGHPSRKGADIMEAAELREKKHVEAVRDRVASLLAQSKAGGNDTAALEARAAEAMKLNTKDARAEALWLLNQIEMDIPQGRPEVVPARAEDEKLDVPKSVPAAKVKRRSAQKRRRRTPKPEEGE